MTFTISEIIMMLVVFAYGLYRTYNAGAREGYYQACEDVAYERITVEKNESNEE